MFTGLIFYETTAEILKRQNQDSCDSIFTIDVKGLHLNFEFVTLQKVFGHFLVETYSVCAGAGRSGYARSAHAQFCAHPWSD